MTSSFDLSFLSQMVCNTNYVARRAPSVTSRLRISVHPTARLHLMGTCENVDEKLMQLTGIEFELNWRMATLK